MAPRRRRTRNEERLDSGYKKAQKPSSRPIKRRLLYTIRLLSGLAAIAAALLLTGWFVFSYNLRSVVVEGAEDTSGIEQAAIEHIDQNEASKNLFLIDIDKLENSLEARFSAQFAGFEAHRAWSSRNIVIKAITREPALIWSTRNSQHVMDAEGVIMSEDPTEGLLVVKDESNLPVEVGSKVAPEHFVTFVREAHGLLSETENLKPESIRVRDTTAEAYIDVGAGFFIRFNTTGSAKLQVDNAIAILEEGANPVDYIDVRLPHKAYWK